MLSLCHLIKTEKNYIKLLSFRLSFTCYVVSALPHALLQCFSLVRKILITKSPKSTQNRSDNEIFAQKVSFPKIVELIMPCLIRTPNFFFRNHELHEKLRGTICQASSQVIIRILSYVLVPILSRYSGDLRIT